MCVGSFAKEPRLLSVHHLERCFGKARRHSKISSLLALGGRISQTKPFFERKVFSSVKFYDEFCQICCTNIAVEFVHCDVLSVWQSTRLQCFSCVGNTVTGIISAEGSDSVFISLGGFFSLSVLKDM